MFRYNLSNNESSTNSFIFYTVIINCFVNLKLVVSVAYLQFVKKCILGNDWLKHNLKNVTNKFSKLRANT